MNKKTVKIIVITVAFILFYHIFLKDFLAYNQAKVKHTSEACEAYLSRFPNGYYVEDVRFIDIEITRNFGKIRKFKQLYAKSKYIDRVNKIYLEIWANEKSRYQANISDLSNPDAVAYFSALLEYLCQNDLYTVSIGFFSDVSLKDFETYPVHVKDALELDFKSAGFPAIATNIYPLGSNYSQGQISILEEIVISALQRSLDQVFSKGFLKVSKLDGQIGADNRPMMLVQYAIKNQEDKNVPVLWNLLEEQLFKAYVLGISIDFVFASRVPADNDAALYSFADQYFPTEDFTFSGGIEDGYAKMTQQVFNKFAANISTNFSLPVPVADSLDYFSKHFLNGSE